MTLKSCELLELLTIRLNYIKLLHFSEIEGNIKVS
jgi:hypothetical protein